MMHEIFKITSTNGRWGVAVVAAEEIELKHGAENYAPYEPLRGQFVRVGVIDGLTVYRLDQEADGFALIAPMNVKMLCGDADVIETMFLQSSRYISLINLPGDDSTIITFFGYKGRHSWTRLYKDDGEVEKVEPSVLLAMGVI